MIKSRWLAIPGASVLCLVTVWVTNAQAPAQEPSLPLYCRGPLSTFRTAGGAIIKTPFKWAKEAASKANPGPGECAWADRPPQATEIKPADDNVMVGNLGPFDDLPVGTYGKICVFRATNNDLVVRAVTRGTAQNAPFQNPPFSSGGCPG